MTGQKSNIENIEKVQKELQVNYFFKALP